MSGIIEQQLQAGKFFVNELKGTVREVIRLIDVQNIAYREFDLLSGKPLTTVQHNCSRRQMMRWADREASLEEVAGLDRAEAQRMELESAREMALLFLESVPDDMLLAEIHRRGLH